MIPSKGNGWILPKGKWDGQHDTDWESCARRVAIRKAGLVLGPLTYLGTTPGRRSGIVWYSGTVKETRDPTDTSARDYETGVEFSFSYAFNNLRTHELFKYKLPMWNALQAAIEKAKRTRYRG
ncbi:hypothetical protein PgNI_06657 [Pyricularia grisea]|uniref:Nudix hydrolase domain-containing protein n=1 Tax=Pyricularia grisea TaxID=148305 RepID=A0A6P8B4Y7_PYRGI|nr:hypothetical protein PgNI_06657 [Pyricularia grisea]TLD10189.1 hypothetical protein PgNI_06657 [Pyricularia grisea]